MIFSDFKTKEVINIKNRPEETKDREVFEHWEMDTVKGKRTFVFYCHLYSRWERGTSENTNRLIHRRIPKGTDFDDNNFYVKF